MGLYGIGSLKNSKVKFVGYVVWVNPSESSFDLNIITKDK
jgi:hypothetical protein